MDISFQQHELKRLDFSLSREWIDMNPRGSYAASTIAGINTRLKHGLFVIPDSHTSEYSVILSQLHEEIILKDVRYPLFNTEYLNQPSVEGMQWMTGFDLDPVPRFSYNLQEIQILKSVVMMADSHQIIVSYDIRGENLNPFRLIIRPFFAFRSALESADKEQFENREVFLMDQQFRYLPFRDAREIFVQFPEGSFINSPTLYQEFLYRHESARERVTENLLAPGFFEIPVKTQSNIFISVSLKEMSPDNTAERYHTELERRQRLLKADGTKSGESSYFRAKISHFKRDRGKPSFSYYVADLFDNDFHLTIHCFILLKLFKSGLKEEEARKLIEPLSRMLNTGELRDLFSGVNSDVRVEQATPFLVAFVLYFYHRLYDKTGKYSSGFVEIFQEIIDLLRKNKLPYFRLKRGKLLERQYRKSDMDVPHDYRLFFPIRQNFLLNVFWYNLLKMTIDIGAVKNMKMRRYRRWANKIANNFQQKYVKPLMSEPVKGPENYAFAFHPGMILAITLPFPILEKKQSQTLYRLLIKQFLDKSGIKFPVRTANDTRNIISPLLFAEYLEGWEKLMMDKDFLLKFFTLAGEEIKRKLKNDIVGYIPNYFGKGLHGDIPRPSGVMMAEMVSFYHRMDLLKKTPSKNS